MTDARLSEAREYAIRQNINILRNRVNNWASRRPVVQRGRRPYCGFELRGIRDTARAKFSARDATLNSVW